jgi:Common central domain of tyrosinase.
MWMNRASGISSKVLSESLDDPNFYRAIGGWAKHVDRGKEEHVRAGAGHFESPAHDYVHIRVGGDMATGLSPNDPSFWAHHSMMDRLWWEWNARGHPNVDDGQWLEWRFEDHFIDRHGDVVDITVKEVLELPEVEYTFDARIEDGDADVEPSTQSNTAEVELNTLHKKVLGEEVTLGVNSDLTGTIDYETVAPYIDGTKQGRVIVAARDIAMPEDGWFHGRVYVDPKSKNPGPGSPRYAGTYHLWIAPPMHPDQNQYVDITATLEDLHEKDNLEDKIDIRVAGDRMRSKGDAEPSTPLKEFTVEVNQSVIDGDVDEY